jgi:hypothetical protein
MMVSACGSSGSNQGGGTSGTGATGGTAGSGGTGGSPGAGGEGGGGVGGDSNANPFALTVVTLRITEAPSLEDPFRGPPLEGVDVCDVEEGICQTTDAEGVARVVVRSNTEFSYTIAKEGYAPYLLADVSDELQKSLAMPLLSDAIMEADAARLGTTWPLDAHGILAFRVLENRAAATFILHGAEGTAFYIDDDGSSSLELTGTTMHSRGGFLEVAEGVHLIEFGGNAFNCVPSVAWPGDGPNQIRVPVEPGMISFGSMACDALF